MTTANDFISQLVDDGYPSQPWPSSTFENDFILLSEFSEMVGPKPIFTIPMQHNSKFDLNEFAVRIMSVDCVSIMQTTDFSSFNIAGDIQVVLTESKEGAVAYVHHFVLYDICARGFVRPYCLAYITRNHTELMAKFNDLLGYFQTVSSLYHFGNTLNFLLDLSLRMKHLRELKEALQCSTKDICIDGKTLTQSQKESISLSSLDESMQQLKELTLIFKDYCERDMFQEHRDIFRQRYKEILNCSVDTTESSETDSCAVDECIPQEDGFQLDIEEGNGITIQTKSTHHVPSDVVSSILGKKYDKPLRNLNTLCDVTFDPGIEMLKYCLDSITHEEYSKHTSPSPNGIFNQASKLQFGMFEFSVAPFSSTDRGCDLHTKEAACQSSLKNLLFVKAGYELRESNGSNKVDIIKPDSVDGTQKETMNINNSFLSDLKITNIPSPVHSTSKLPVRLDSYVNIPSVTPDVALDVNSSTSQQSSTVNISANQSEGSPDSFKDALEHFSSKSSTPDSLFTKIEFNRCSSVISTASSFSNTSEHLKYSKVSLLSLRKKYSFLPHAVFSLFIGRPLIVLGEEKHMKNIKRIIYGLANFLVTDDHAVRKIIPWSTEMIKLEEMGKVGLCGLMKSNSGISNSLKPYVSILDYENQTLVAPSYTGKFLADMFETSKHFTTEDVYRRYVHQIFSQIMNIVYVQFTAQYAQSGKYSVANIYGLRLYGDIHMMQGKLLAGDLLILRELVERLREQVMSAVCNEGDLEMIVTASRKTIKLNTLKSSLYVNKNKK